MTRASSTRQRRPDEPDRRRPRQPDRPRLQREQRQRVHPRASTTSWRPTSRVGAAYTWRKGTDIPSWFPRIGHRPSADYTPNAPVTAERLHGADVRAGPGQDRRRSGGRILTNRPDYSTGYNGFELTLIKRLSNQWMVRAAFSLDGLERVLRRAERRPEPDPDRADGRPGGSRRGASRSRTQDRRRPVRAAVGRLGQGRHLLQRKWQFVANALYQLPAKLRGRRQPLRPRRAIALPDHPAPDAGGDGAIRRVRRRRDRRPSATTTSGTSTSAWRTTIKIGGNASLQLRPGPVQRRSTADVILARNRQANSAAFGPDRRDRQPADPASRACASVLVRRSRSCPHGPGALTPGPFLSWRAASIELRMAWRDGAKKRRARDDAAAPPQRPRPRTRRRPGRPRGRVAVAWRRARLAAAWLVAASRSARPNLLLVTIDTLRADHVGAYGTRAGARRRRSTPWPRAASASSTRRARSRSPGPRTPRSSPASTRPCTACATTSSSRSTRVTTLADAPQGARATARRPSWAPIRWPRPSASARASTSSTRTSRRARCRARGRSGPANEVADDAIAWLAGQARRPFFAWVHFYDPHAPYDPPEPYRTRVRRPPLRRRDRVHRRADRPRPRRAARRGPRGGHRRRGGGRPRRVARRARRADPRRPDLRVDAARALPARRAGRAPGVVVAARVRHGRPRCRPFCGLLGFAPAGRLPGRDLRPAFRGERLPPEPLYAESLFGRLNCRWSSLRALTEGDWKLIEGSRSRAVRPRRGPGRDAQPRRRASRDARRAHARRPARGAGEDGARRATGRAAAHRPEQEAIAAQPRLRRGFGGRGRARRARACPIPATASHLYERLQVIQRAAEPCRSSRRSAEAVGDRGSRTPATPSRIRPWPRWPTASGGWAPPPGPTAARSSSTPTGPACGRTSASCCASMGRLEESEKELRLAVEQTDADDPHAGQPRGDAGRRGASWTRRAGSWRTLIVEAPKDPEVAARPGAMADRDGPDGRGRAGDERGGRGPRMPTRWPSWPRPGSGRATARRHRRRRRPRCSDARASRGRRACSATPSFCRAAARPGS